MGAWSYGPFENDSALDWASGIENQIAKQIRRALKVQTTHHYSRMEKVAAAALLVELTETRMQPLHLDLNYEGFHHKLFDVALRAISALREDHEAIAAWRNPKRYEKALDDLLDKLKWRKLIAARRFKRLKSRIILRAVPAKKSHKARKSFPGGKP